jgi:hypothetical protein
MLDNVLPTVQKFILQIFYPVTNYLNSALQYLDQVQIQPARALKLDYFLGPISVLGPEWRALVGAIIGCLLILFTAFVVRGIYNLYLLFKTGVKWW